MTKEVTVIIDGLQFGAEDEAVSMIAPGVYHHSHGKHYIQYEENAESGEGSTQSTIKITPKRIEIVKKGVITSHMIFAVGKPSQTLYQTPYGDLFLEIQTNELVVEATTEEILASFHYTLSANGDYLSDNRIVIRVGAKS